MAYTILLADDSSTLRHSAEHILGGAGYRLLLAENGRQALERLDQRRPSLILADALMPELDGYELCRRVKERPETAAIPVLLLTGTFEPFDIQRAKDARYDGYVPKPFDAQDLLRRVESAIAAAGVPPEPPEEEPAPTPEAAQTSPPTPLPDEFAWFLERYPQAPGLQPPAAERERAGGPPSAGITGSDGGAAAAPPPELASPPAPAATPAGEGTDTAARWEMEREPFGHLQEFPALGGGATGEGEEWLGDLELDRPPTAAFEQGVPPAAPEAAAAPELSLNPPGPGETPGAGGEPGGPAGEAVPELLLAAGGTGERPQETGIRLDEGQLDDLARRVVGLLSDRLVREIARQVVPETAERLIGERIRRIEEEVERGEGS